MTDYGLRITEPGVVSLRVFDLLGRVVATVFEGRLEAGRHVVRFDASRLAPGVYLCVLTARGGSATRRMVVR